MLYLLVSKSLQARHVDTLQKAHRGGVFHYMYENDLFTGTDRYYTQGSVVELCHPLFAKSPLSKVLINLQRRKRAQNYISFRQDVFTPKSILNKVLDSTDRPYAGTFFFSQKLVSKRWGSNLTTSIDLGCLGPAALSEQMQKFIHAHTRNAAPIGWENQVANSFIANYNLLYEHGFLLNKWFNIFGELGAKAGMLYTNASTGILLRFGKMNSYVWMHKPRAFSKWELYGTLNGIATYVQYNAVLQGLPWVKSVHVLSANKIERLLYKLEATVSVSYEQWSLIYSTSFITPEFKGGLPHGWGGCNIIYRF